MPDYSSSIKCKYCDHFDPTEGLCYRLASHDHVKEVSPNSRCKYFCLNDVDMMANAIYSEKGSTLPRRKDGSYVASIDDVPELKAKYEAQDAANEEKRLARNALLIGGIILLNLLFLWPFLEMFFDILNFLS